MQYKIDIHTGKEPGSETDSRVYVKLIGERGTTGRRLLLKDRKGQRKYLAGEVIYFNLHRIYQFTNTIGYEIKTDIHILHVQVIILDDIHNTHLKVSIINLQLQLVSVLFACACFIRKGFQQLIL